MKATRRCSVEGCDRSVHARELCKRHYGRWIRNGAIHLRSDADRFAARYEIAPNGCWEWLRGVSTQGYAIFYFDGRSGYGHRYAVIHIKGQDIPSGMHVDHLCRNRRCVNPDHLEIVTPAENLDRGEIRLRQREWLAAQPPSTHCTQGHEWTPENTRDTGGKQRCRACDRDYQRRKYAERKISRPA